MEIFSEKDLFKLWKPDEKTGKYTGGQVTIVGGSKLFHGAPILSLKASSRVVSMVYLATPEEDREIADEVKIKSSLSSFIWVPREDLNDYIDKSDAVLIGPGMMRNRREGDGWVCDDSGRVTREITVELLSKFPLKKWVIDGGSLQVIDPELLPKGTVITPNRKEYEMLFKEKLSENNDEAIKQVIERAKTYNLVILYKDRISMVTDGERQMVIEGGGNGLISGGVGDLLAGLILGLLAKNDPILAVAAASYLVKKTAEKLEKERGLMFNADDVADNLPMVYGEIVGQ